MRRALAALAVTVGWVFGHPAAAEDPFFTARAAAVVQSYLDSERFSGTVLVAVDGKAVFRQGFGFADRNQRIPNTPDTTFRIGSITKPITSVAVLQLVEQGKLSLDDPISKHYANAPLSWAKITIRHLLSQRSGIPSVSDRADWATWSKTHRSPDEVIATVHDLPLRFEPGAKYEYSNTNHTILGLVIEAVTGQSYEAYMQSSVFAPLGMRDTGLDRNDKFLTRRAIGYEFLSGTWKEAGYVSMTIPYAAGSLYSTVDDLLKWDQSLDAGKLISAEMRRAMFTDPGDGYGFGWYVGNWFGNTVQSHSGRINGFHAIYCRYPDDKLTVIVLANLWSAPVAWIANELAALHLGVFRTLGRLCLYES